MLTIKLWSLLAFFIAVVRCQVVLKDFISGDISNIPYAVNIRTDCGPKSKQPFNCMATVIEGRILLTAAHCVFKCTGKKDIVEATASGGINEALQPRKVTEIKVHEEYSDRATINDIALLLVDRDFQFGQTFNYVTVESKPQFFPSPGATAFIAGSSRRDNVTKSDNSQKTNFKLVKQKLWKLENCGKVGDIKPGIFCTSSCSNKDYLPLKGDSGSGLVTDVAGTTQVVGLVSHRFKTIPIVTFYTNVTHFMPWIEKQIKKLKKH